MKYILKKEYPGSPKLGNIIDNLENDWIENYPEFWEEVVEKDYEILSFINQNKSVCKVNDTNYLESYILANLHIFKIHSIKRLSDSEIFTIGDKCSPIGKYRDNIHSITKIWFCNPGYLRLSSNNYTLGIKDIQKVKIPLFTSEDGVNIFEGDKFYTIGASQGIWYHDKTIIEESVAKIRTGQLHESKCIQGNKLYWIKFSTKEKAEEYILMNKPCLSYNDILNATKIRNKNTFETLKDLVKSKIQQSV